MDPVPTVSQDLARTTFITWPLNVSTLNGEAKMMILQISKYQCQLRPCVWFSMNCLDIPCFSIWYAVTWENGLDAFREGLEELLQYTLAVVLWGTFLQDLATSTVSTFWVGSDLGTGQEIMTFSYCSNYPQSPHPVLLSLVMNGRRYSCCLPISFSPCNTGFYKTPQLVPGQAPLTVSPVLLVIMIILTVLMFGIKFCLLDLLCF